MIQNAHAIANQRQAVIISLIVALLFISTSSVDAAKGAFVESGGLVVVEAENYHSKTTNGKPRDYYLFPASASTPKPDPDSPHPSGASNGKYLEILPDTRVDHDDVLKTNVNFFAGGSNAPQLGYKVKITSGGRYYVWARAYSTGTEDNGIHVGYDGKWPTTGTAMQWCEGKEKWTWSSARRLESNHCGVRNGIYLELSAGEHTINFGMREDGFEFDRFLLVKNKSYTPSGVGPAESSRTDSSGDGDTGTPENQAPSANAGSDASVNLSDTLTLNGSATDDGLPNGNIDISWKKISGPGTVILGDSSALKTTVRFGAKGSYVLRLIASDGEQSDSDTIGIDVIDDTPNPENTAPTVKAGPNQTVHFSESAVLSGSASDDGLPNDQLSVTWRKVSGPGSVNFGDIHRMTTTADFSDTGLYVLELTVSDGELRRSDKISVEVIDPTDGDTVAPPTDAFMQDRGDQGLVVIEAENFSENIGRGEHYWIEATAPESYSGYGIMTALPDQGVKMSTGYEVNSPYLRFHVQFTQTGRHYVWVRCFAGGGDNSLHAGLNGEGISTAENITVPIEHRWVWANETSNGSAYLDIHDAGKYAIDIWMREDGVILDKILLTTDQTFAPEGQGPDESSLTTDGDTGTEDPPIEDDDTTTGDTPDPGTGVDNTNGDTSSTDGNRSSGGGGGCFIGSVS